MIHKLRPSFAGLFNNLCLSQVKEQLSGNLMYDQAEPAAFVCKGNLYLFTDHRLLVNDTYTCMPEILN